MEFISKAELEQQIEEEKQFSQRSINFLKKLYPVVKSAGYDFSLVDNDQFRDIVTKTACMDTSLLTEECEASKILFDGYNDEDIIEAIKVPIQQNVVFIKPEISVEKYIDLMKAELDLRRSSIKWVLNSEFTNLRIMKYHVDIVKFCPNTTMLLLLLAFNKMKREGML